MTKISLIALLLAFIVNTNYAQTFSVKDSTSFIPQKKKLFLFQNPSEKRMILFKSDIQVNTDGAPNSYHPEDLKGDSIALNSILMAVTITRLKDTAVISLPPKKKYPDGKVRASMRAEAYKVFGEWENSGYSAFPDGYKIHWNSVLIPDATDQNKPCILKTGPYKGYFVSGTSLTNKLKAADAGECGCNNFVNPMEVATFVLPKGKNYLVNNGAKLGDFVVAYNLANKNIVYAVIGDKGPEDKLGEGSVMFNMKLKGTDKVPTHGKEADALTNSNILVCIIPGSLQYKTTTPYAQENIQERILSWFAEQGYGDETRIKEFFEQNKRLFK